MNMKNYKWFWITFCGWCFITTMGAWALIFSPFHSSSKKISEFQVEINGYQGQNQVLTSSAPIDRSLKELTGQWEGEGWKSLTNNLNLAPILMNIPKNYEKLASSLIQLQIFQKNGDYRLLGLLNDVNSNQTYQWIDEVPKKALQGQDPSKVEFPLKPPQNASNILTVKSEKIETCSWSFLTNSNIEDQFIHTYASQGFSGRTWSKQPGESIYILQRGSVKLLATLNQSGGKNIISLVKLKKT
jgi:hypothetical protein